MRNKKIKMIGFGAAILMVLLVLGSPVTSNIIKLETINTSVITVDETKECPCTQSQGSNSMDVYDQYAMNSECADCNQNCDDTWTQCKENCRTNPTPFCVYECNYQRCVCKHDNCDYRPNGGPCPGPERECERRWEKEHSPPNQGMLDLAE